MKKKGLKWITGLLVAVAGVIAALPFLMTDSETRELDDAARRAIGGDFIRVRFRDEHRLLFHFIQGRHEQFFSLGAHGDQHVIGKCLGDRMGFVTICQFRIGLDVDNLQGYQLGAGHGGFQCVEGLLRAVRAGGANEDLDVARTFNFFKNSGRLFIQAGLSGPDA